jgi:crotonobetainyl-CoA:carnitine CoA-transferase CaiB-like acyl-CoA transferase
MMRPLEGITVLDLTRLLPGAVATQWLADFGAEVIKIEQPGVGDYARHSFTDGSENPVFAATNRGKQSVAIDLKRETGREAFLKLVESADVLMEGFRPGVMERLGLGFETLAPRFPRLIYVALTGYGREGSYSALAGHDINYLALAGVLDLMGPRESPALAGVQFADLAGGSMQAVIGVLMALQARHRTGGGQRVDVSMFAGSAALLTVPGAIAQSTGRVPERGNELLSGRYACYQIYAAKEGFVAVGALEPKFWENLCRALGREDLIADQFADEPRQSGIKQSLAAILATRTAEEWFAELGARDCCITPVRNVKDALRDHPGAPIPLLSATPGSGGGRVPGLGEHTREILNRAGLTPAEVDRLTSQGAIA